MAPFRWRGLAALAVLLVVVALSAPVAALETRPEGIGPRSPTPTGILVNIAARTLYWYADGKLVRSFPVGVGKPDSETPTGRYAVEYKEKNPWWFPRGKAPVPPGPANPLGTRWIGFNGPYGIHGNNNPASVGNYVSLGCVRMYIPDVEWLYDRVSVGTPVTVVYEPVQLQYDAGGRRYLAVYPNGYGWKASGPADVLAGAGYAPDTVGAAGADLYLLDVKVEVNGQEIGAILHRGKPYVQARALAGKLSAAVGWNPLTRLVSLDGLTLPSVLQGTTGYVDAEAAAAVLGVEYEWDASAGVARLTGQPLFLNGHLLGRSGRTLNGEPYLPVRLVAEAAGATVGWDDARGQALVNGRPISSVLHRERAFAAAEVLGRHLHLGVQISDTAVSLGQ